MNPISPIFALELAESTWRLASSMSRVPRIAVLLAPFVVGACVSAPRIDGRSESSFRHTYAELLASLSPEERTTLYTAELIVISPDCFERMPNDLTTGIPWINRYLAGQVDKEPCRHELHGMTFRSIVKRADRMANPKE